MYHSVFVDETIVNLHLSHLYIINGYANETGENAQGAGIFNKGNIVLKHVEVTDNKSIILESAIYNQGSIQMSEDVTLKNNGSI